VTIHDWQDDALCATTAPDLFHPEKGRADLATTAKAICARCTVRDECLAYALTTGQDEGVWGGLSAKERRALTRGAAA